MNRYDVEIQTESEVNAEVVTRLRQAAETTLRSEDLRSSVSLTILLTGDDRLKELNQLFRGHDEPTDVLSFPAGDSIPELENYLGDIAISLSMAERQASRGNHGLEDELILLVVHGVLHLLGYDHAEPVDREEMWSVQRRVLTELGVGRVALAVEGS